MKWNNNDVKYERGNYECLIAQYNKSGAWVCVRAMATQQTQKHSFKALGEVISAKEIEVKKLYGDNDELTETNIILFDNMAAYGGGFQFWTCNEELERTEKINVNYLDKYLPIPTLKRKEV